MLSPETCARDLVEARRSLTVLDPSSGSGRPTSLNEGYAIQRVATQQWDDEIAGWKVGATAREIQKLFGISECIYGPVFEKTVFRSPAHLSSAQFHHRMLESEFAFQFCKDLPPRQRPYDREEIIDAVDALFPSFEIVSPRFPRLTIDDIPQLVADFCANGGAVLGTACSEWKACDLAAHRVELWIGGSLRQAGSGASVIGDPLNALEWMVNVLRARGLSIARGQFVLTGTTTGIHTPAIDEKAIAEFGEFGRVELVFE